MLEKLAALQHEALSIIGESRSGDDLQEVRIAFLGKKGKITAISRSMGDVSRKKGRPLDKLLIRQRILSKPLSQKK